VAQIILEGRKFGKKKKTGTEKERRSTALEGIEGGKERTEATAGNVRASVFREEVEGMGGDLAI